jgi:hypothetical protein
MTIDLGRFDFHGKDNYMLRFEMFLIFSRKRIVLKNFELFIYYVINFFTRARRIYYVLIHEHQKEHIVMHIIVRDFVDSNYNQGVSTLITASLCPSCPISLEFFIHAAINSCLLI